MHPHADPHPSARGDPVDMTHRNQGNSITQTRLYCCALSMFVFQVLPAGLESIGGQPTPAFAPPPPYAIDTHASTSTCMVVAPGTVAIPDYDGQRKGQ